MAGRIKPLAEKTKKVRMEKYDADISVITEIIEKYTEEKEEIESLIENVDEDISKYKEKVPLIAGFLNKWGFPVQNTLIKSHPAPYNKSELRSNVIDYLDKEGERLDLILEDYKSLRSNLESESLPGMPALEPCDHALARCKAPLNNVDRSQLGGWGGGSETYFFLGDGYKEDCNTVSSASKNAFERTRVEIYGTIPEFQQTILGVIGQLEQERGKLGATR